MSRLNQVLFATAIILRPFSHNAQDVTIREPVRFLALGDSYTIGESVSVADRWPQQLIDSIAARGFETEKLTIIARTGWRTDNLRDAIISRDPPKDFNLVSLLIGVNDQYQGFDEEWYKPRFEELLLTAVECAQGNKDAVFVLSIPDYAYTPFGRASSTITKEIDAFNNINKSITQTYNIAYIDITPISREGLANPSLVASDGLHPSGLMYSRWVSLILDELNIENVSTITETQLEVFDLSVFPNPATDVIDFNLPGEPYDYINIQIYNAVGQLITRLNSSGQPTIRVNTSGYASGIYYYHVVTDAGDYLRGKFIII